MVGGQPVVPSQTDDHPERLDRSVSEEVLCPRCGYDLRGAIASWRESCPMEGRCAECGLEFEWSWMFRQRLHPWLFEHQWRRLHLFSAGRTMLASCRPGRLTREITLMHPVRLWPLVLLLATLALTIAPIRLFGLFYAMLNAGVLRGRAWWSSRFPHGYGGIVRMEAQDFAVFVATVALLAPLAFLVIPASLQRVRVRPAHVVRQWLYLLIGLASIVLLLSLVQSAWFFIFAQDTPRWMRPGDWRIVPIARGDHWAKLVFVDTVRPVWAIAVLWTWHWWRVICRDYLRLPDATLTATLLTTIVALASYLVQHGLSVWEELT